MMKKISFELIDPAAKPGEYMSAEEPSPYFGLSKEQMERSLKYLQDGDEVVIPKNEIRVEINYPFANSHIFTLTPQIGEVFTRSGLGIAIALKYQEMYDEEEKSTNLPIESVAERSGGKCHLMNRARTDGKYGIWGHDLSDLDLHTVEYDVDLNLWILGIDS
jgi:hypothetical protein